MPAAGDLRIEALQRLVGGASREAWIFDLRWREHGVERFEPCILMREPRASVLISDSAPSRIDGTRRTVASEVQVVRAMRAAGLPVPDILWADAEGVWLERPFSIARRLPGTTDVSGLIGTPAVEGMLDEFVHLLARIHTLEPGAAGVAFLGTPSRERAALEQVLQFERNFDRERLEPFPAADYLVRWLKKNAPVADRVRVIHGDYRLGNFLHENGQIIAILDWEQVHVGDPVEEIAFMYWALWTLEPVCPIETFITRYEAASGTTVNRATLAWYRAFIELKMLVVLLTGLRSYYATPERQLHYASAQTNEMIRDAQLRVIEEFAQGGPTVAFDAYQKSP
jgi:aminoglycoside phosphotransferase (APT) family kinase protein